MANRIPLVIANGRFQQQQAADTLSVPGPYTTPSYYEVGEIATPATPAAGLGRIYAKSDNKLYFLNDLGTEVDLSASSTTPPAGVTGAVQFNNAGVFGADSANFFWDDTNNRLGIGTATPGNTLHVAGSARVTTTLQVDGNSTLGDAAGDTLTINGTAVSIPNNLNFDSNTFFINSSTDRVGIGTATPTSKLEVVDTTNGYAGIYFQNASTDTTGRAQLSAYNSANGINAGILSTGFVGTLPGTSVVANEAFVLANGLPAGLVIESAPNGSYIRFGIFAVEKARIAATEFVVNDAGGIYNFRVESDNDANNLFSDGTNNRIGIGTAAPLGKLQVNNGATTDPVIVLQDNGVDVLRVNDGGVLLQDGGAVFNSAGAATADFQIQGDTEANVFFVDASADRAGIGTSSPLSGLDVQTSQGVKRRAIANADATVNDTDFVIAYTSISAARVVNLPTAVGRTGRMLWVKDESGSASVVNTITIDPSGSETIDGAATLVIALARGRAQFYSDGTNWQVLTAVV